MLIDMHAHTSGISTCCKADGARVLAAARSVGIDGVCLVNHYHKPYLEETGESPSEFAERYLAEYEAVRALGNEMALRVLFGIEVTMERHNRVHILIYGVEPDFVRRHLTMFDYTQEELYRAAHEGGGLLVQAHPLRLGKNSLLDPKYLDGVEISSHLLYDGTHYAELAEFARANGLLLTSGGDYHADTPRPTCGLYLPEDLADARAIMTYLQRADRIKMCMQESRDTAPEIKVFEKD